MNLTATFNPQVLNVSVGGKLGVSTGIPVVKEYVELPVYTGAYSVTPSADAQTLETENKRLLQDLVINPIPSNYGLITWNGAFLTVS